jgi:hypothetical protein
LGAGVYAGYVMRAEELIARATSYARRRWTFARRRAVKTMSGGGTRQ